MLSIKQINCLLADSHVEELVDTYQEKGQLIILVKTITGTPHRITIIDEQHIEWLDPLPTKKQIAGAYESMIFQVKVTNQVVNEPGIEHYDPFYQEDPEDLAF